ncbi:hypothetical protein CJD36_012420 [Flavipsychrobacter stenotrophus]|uniref:histidine kinase n=1 Tax=Flavipsychrobacter stenotrophus TaxID=2077091 RepID=A0A2S7SV24_9BACT|nr:PAS domain-containing sensor histidine kinase [Flavipsychrobacter stenotrophus]PQJ10769.1 hypothetical protein CJD36_012420 [Flavipsychrobacter stenotrophus]
MWMEMFGSVTTYNGAPAIIGTMVNITEQKEMYDDLARSEANLKSIFNNTQASFLLVDQNINILACNEYFRIEYAYQTGIDLRIGLNMLDLLLPERLEPIKKIFESVKANGIAVDYETTYTNRQLPKHVSATISPVLNNGAIIGFCYVGFDITNRKNLEIEKQKMVADLFNRNRDLQEFAQIVSHNLRAPLATLLGLNNMLKDSESEEEKDFVLENIAITSEKIDVVVRELNNILDVKQDSLETSTAVDLNELWKEIHHKFEDLIAKSHAEITIDFTTISNVFTLRSYLFNILYSLVSNSLKYKDKERPLKIRIWTEQLPGKTLLIIQDNGTGIDMNRHKDQLFLLNKRFHNTSDGKGMGLYIAKAQVDILQGTIEMDSEPGAGTTVRVILPSEYH